MVETNLHVMFLRDVVLLPFNEIRLEFKSESDKEILNQALNYHDGHLLFINLEDQLETNPHINDLPKIGVVGKIKSKIELPGGLVRVVILGIDRVEVLNYLEQNEILEAFVIPTKEYDYNELEATALKRVLFRNLDSYIETSPSMSNNVIGRLMGINSISRISDIIVFELPLSYRDKIKYVYTTNPMYRIRAIIEDLTKEIETVRLENEIEEKLRMHVEDSQHEYMLREKIKIIREELGDSDVRNKDIEKLKEIVSNLDCNAKVKKRLEEEINRYEIIPDASPEISIVRGYIDWLINLPWNNSTKDNYNLDKISKVLDSSHYGLDKVKSRILEFVAVKKQANYDNTPILCLVGPPGCGKTSLAKSIALALNKKFVKISVGGVHDEAEIIGHRRTYIGASAGKIIQGIRKAGSNNPVFLIDEIDKLTKDYRGDPASCLLDILDKEQNNIFVDNYIEEEFDLSKVMFILTANREDTIPSALRDRLEIIEVSSYTVLEKLKIAKDYLIPKYIKNYDLRNIILEDEAILKIINDYTKEAGVRDLERKLASVFRKVLLKKEKDKIISKDEIHEYLGIEKYNHVLNDDNKIGVVNALSYTPYGGELLKVSVTSYKGKGEIKLTGSLGDVMKESVYIALSYIKTNYQYFNLDYDLFSLDYHLHFEEGAILKDGPSAGVTIVSAILSLLKKKKIASDISMTGEMTLRGRILPIGGLKEKLIAALANNINKVYIPSQNKKDLEDIPSEVRDKLKIILVSDYQEIYDDLFKEETRKG